MHRDVFLLKKNTTPKRANLSNLNLLGEINLFKSAECVCISALSVSLSLVYFSLPLAYFTLWSI